MTIKTLFAMMFIFVLAVTTGLSVFWLLFDTSPVLVQKSAVWVDSFSDVPLAQAKAGKTIYIKREICSGARVALPIVTGRRMVRLADNLSYAMGTSSGKLDPGCATIPYAVRLPADLEPGIYRYVTTVTLPQNPLVDVVVSLASPQLQVVQ